MKDHKLYVKDDIFQYIMTYTSYIKPLENKWNFPHQLFQTLQTQEHKHYINPFGDNNRMHIVTKVGKTNWWGWLILDDTWVMVGNEISNIYVGCCYRSM
jgi:hypothetical protein